MAKSDKRLAGGRGTVSAWALALQCSWPALSAGRRSLKEVYIQMHK